ncbi:MAG: HipA domain-containing protein [Bryobacterales bacterium]|nr:HipA domain-containing protein [Bryobacterales bacterium]
MVSNTDDHLKNHGLLHVGEGRWVLAPAFDINPQPFRRRQLETGISELSGNTASLETAVEASPFFGMARDAAANELSLMTSIIDEQWRPLCRAAGMSSEEVKLYQPAFDHEETRVARRIKARAHRQTESA